MAMAEEPGYLIGPKLLAEIRNAVRHYASMYGGGESTRPRQQTQDRRWAILGADLLAAVDSLTDPSTAQANFVAQKANGDFEILTESATIVNRFENISIDAGTLIGVEWMAGEWTPYKGDCSQQSAVLFPSQGGSGGPNSESLPPAESL
jgi:hypothetical protein